MAEWVQTPESSHVVAIKYEPETQDVHVQFNDGSEYVYSNVPSSVWEELLDAGSKGRFINIVLRRRFPYSRVS